jgi:hypothetical protein
METKGFIAQWEKAFWQSRSSAWQRVESKHPKEASARDKTRAGITSSTQEAKHQKEGR